MVISLISQRLTGPSIVLHAIRGKKQQQQKDKIVVNTKAEAHSFIQIGSP